MKRLLLTVVVCSLFLALGVIGFGEATAATKGDQGPKANGGATQILVVDGGTAITATKVFTGIPGRNAFAVFNNGPQTIYCGWSTAVNEFTGFPVIAASSLSIDMVWNASGDKDFYCTTVTVNQASPLDTRWIQVK